MGLDLDLAFFRHSEVEGVIRTYEHGHVMVEVSGVEIQIPARYIDIFEAPNRPEEVANLRRNYDAKSTLITATGIDSQGDYGIIDWSVYDQLKERAEAAMKSPVDPDGVRYDSDQLEDLAQFHRGLVELGNRANRETDILVFSWC